MYDECNVVKYKLEKLNGSMSTRATSMFKDPNVANTCLTSMRNILLSLQTRYLPIVFVCNSNYIDNLIKSWGIDNSLGNSQYTTTAHMFVLSSFPILASDEELDLTLLDMEYISLLYVLSWDLTLLDMEYISLLYVLSWFLWYWGLLLTKKLLS